MPQTSNVNAKKWIGKAYLYFKTAVDYAELASNVSQPVQQEVSSNGGQQHRQSSRRVQPQMQS